MSFADKIATMGGGYLDRTEARLRALVRTVDEGRLDPDEARRTFHDIVGTAPMFGFVALGERARSAEDEAAAHADDTALRARAEDLLTLVAELRPA